MGVLNPLLGKGEKRARSMFISSPTLVPATFPLDTLPAALLLNEAMLFLEAGRNMETLSDSYGFPVLILSGIPLESKLISVSR